MHIDHLYQMESSDKNPVKRVLKKVRYKLMRRYIDYVRVDLDRIQKNSDKRFHTLEKRVRKLQKEVNGDYEGVDYISFETTFRGSKEEILKRQKEYLPYLKDCKTALDIGCGRGELLELLQQEGIQASGVELYEPYAKAAGQKGLQVVHGDGIDYLRHCAKVDAVMAMQVVEHLSASQVTELVRLAYESLNPNGVLILETPNPMSLYTFTHAFYIDPTHRKPVHPYYLRYVAHQAGFSDVEILFTQNSKAVPDGIDLKAEIEKSPVSSSLLNDAFEMMYGSQDYAIIAHKGSADNIQQGELKRLKELYHSSEVPFSEAYISVSSGMESGVFDVGMASGLTNEEFLQLAYIKLFNRYAGEDDLKGWKDTMMLPPDQFQRSFIKAVADSEELKHHRSRIVNASFVQ